MQIEDLIYISKASLGLRHVSSKERASKELTEGVQSGDFLAVSSVGGLLEGPVPNSPFLLSQLPFSMGLAYLDESQKASLIQRFEGAIKDFMSYSLGMDIAAAAYGEDPKVSEALGKIAISQPSFLIARVQGADMSYDQDSYHGLGKTGKRVVDASDIKGVFGVEASDVNTILPELNNHREGEPQFEFAKAQLTSVLLGKFFTMMQQRPI